MMVARWSIEARFGYKPVVIEQMKRWMKDIGPQIGWSEDKMRLYTGSIGAHESTLQSEVVIRDLEELNDAWEKLSGIDAHRQWGKDLEPYVVSGTPRWEVYRVVD